MSEIVVLRSALSRSGAVWGALGVSLFFGSCALSSENPDQLLPGEEEAPDVTEAPPTSSGGASSVSEPPSGGGSGVTTNWSGASGGWSGVASGGSDSSSGGWSGSSGGSASSSPDPDGSSCEDSGVGCAPEARVVIQSADSSREWTASFTQDRLGPLGIRSSVATAGACGANFGSVTTVAYAFVEVRNDTSRDLLVTVGVNSSQVTGKIAAYASRPSFPGGDVTNEQARAEWDQCLSGSAEYSSFYKDCPSGFGMCLAECSSSTLFGAHPRKAVPLAAESSVWIYVPQADTRGTSSMMKVRLVNPGC